MVKIDYEKCCWQDGKCQSCACGGECVGCAEICPAKAISRNKRVEIDEKACLDCGLCISACEYKALSF